MHIERKFRKFDYNMLVQNHVHYKYVVTLWAGGAMVKDLTPQCGAEEFKPPAT
jgi:hypothetical protein